MLDCERGLAVEGRGGTGGGISAGAEAVAVAVGVSDLLLIALLDADDDEEEWEDIPEGSVLIPHCERVPYGAPPGSAAICNLSTS